MVSEHTLPANTDRVERSHLNTVCSFAQSKLHDVSMAFRKINSIIISRLLKESKVSLVITYLDFLKAVLITWFTE